MTKRNRTCRETSQESINHTNSASVMICLAPRYRVILANCKNNHSNEQLGRNLEIKTAYRKENITVIHEDHNDAPSPCEVGEITRHHEDYGDDVVGHHLPMIFPTCFGIEDKHLVGVESNLG